MSNGKNMSETLRRDRDRFLAFSFAAADALLEIDRDWKVVFAVGAVQSFFGVHDKDFIGSDFLSFLDDGDRILIRSRIARLKDGMRLEPVFFHLKTFDKSLLLSGCRLPHMGDKLFLAISKSGEIAHADGNQAGNSQRLLDEQDFIASSTKPCSRQRMPARRSI